MRRAFCSLLLSASVASAASGETHHFKPTVGYPTFAVRPPVLTVKPGDDGLAPAPLDRARSAGATFDKRKRTTPESPGFTVS